MAMQMTIFCEVLRNTDCEMCYGCTNEDFYFTLYKWRDMISVGFIVDIVVSVGILCFMKGADDGID